MGAEVGRQRARAPLRKEAGSDHDHERERHEHQWHADERELEESDATGSRVLARPRDQHVDRRAGQHQQRARVRGEGERYEELGRRNSKADRDHRGHRDQRRDRGVRSDQRRQQRREPEQRDDQAVAPAASGGDEPLPRPRRHPRRVERLADHEQRRDEDHRLVAEAGQRLIQREHPGGVQRERRAERDDADVHAVGHEQHHRGAEHEERDRRVTHERPTVPAGAALEDLRSPVQRGRPAATSPRDRRYRRTHEGATP
jgi:hypothetical protein